MEVNNSSYSSHTSNNSHRLQQQSYHNEVYHSKAYHLIWLSGLQFETILYLHLWSYILNLSLLYTLNNNSLDTKFLLC